MSAAGDELTDAERIEYIGALACDLLEALRPWQLQRPEVRSACTRLTVALAAVPLPDSATAPALKPSSPPGSSGGVSSP